MAGLATSWLKSGWRHNWKSAQVVNSHLVCDPTIWQPGFDLPRQQWSLLNHFRAEQGHCGACRRKWRLTDTDLCPCGETQTMSHIVESCPLKKLNGGLSRLHSADEYAVSWLTSYGSWHAYEEKKKTPWLQISSSTRKTFAVFITDLREPRPIILSVGNPLSIFVTSRSRLLLDQPSLGNSYGKWHELHFFSTTNAFIIEVVNKIVLMEKWVSKTAKILLQKNH